MFTNVLNVVIGLVFIFLLYSLLATSIQETISTVLHRRANTLNDGIKSMFSNTKRDWGTVGNLVVYLFVGLSVDFWKLLDRLFVLKKGVTLHTRFYDHPIIKNYGQNLLFKKPSYLTPENFSSILIETIKNLDENNVSRVASFDLIKSTLEAHKEEIDKDTLNIITYHLNEAAGDLDVFKYRIEKWYNDTMDRVSGWYKRNTQFYLLFIGFVMAIGLNIDSIEITNYLSDNKTAREQLAKMGEAAAGNPMLAGVDSTIAKEALDSIKASINDVNTLVGLGWGDYGGSSKVYKDKCLTDKTTGLYKAYADKNNKLNADTLFMKDSAKLSAKMNSKAADTPAIQHVLDSMHKNRDEIISQNQFALLYANEKFSKDLKFNYVWYRIWHWRKFFGFLITALAISLGAPFWFDLLNKFVSIRSAVKTVNSSGSTTKNNAVDNNEIDG